MAFGLGACGSNVSQPGPYIPPSPGSATLAEPGGDAPDAHAAALVRLEGSAWGAATDKDELLRLPLPDAELWKRVRFWGVEHFAGFRYGDEHHAVVIALVRDLPLRARVRGDTCLSDFETWAREEAERHGVELGRIGSHPITWRGQPLTVRELDGRVDTLFVNTEFSAAWAAYPAYPHSCLVYAVAVPWRHQRDRARAIRDSWVRHGFTQIEPLTQEKPQRQ